MPDLHAHRLHQLVETECLCCHVVTTFEFKAASDHVICKSCRRHVGETSDKLRLRDADHLGLWSSEMAMLREELYKARDGARATVEKARQDLAALQVENQGLKSALERGVSSASPADIQRILTDKLVTEAQNARDAAFRSKDRAYQVLWRVDGLHHHLERAPETCRCGLGETSCRVLQVMDGVRELLDRWEHLQTARAKEHKPHGLPREHPEYVEIYPYGTRG